MQTKAKQWAALGYNVICPDLFWRQQERVQLGPRTEFAQALEFMHGMDEDHVLAELDSYVSLEARNQIQQNVEQRKDWTYYLYEGCDHAFARPKGEHYDPAADALATERAVEFLKKHIG